MMGLPHLFIRMHGCRTAGFKGHLGVELISICTPKSSHTVWAPGHSMGPLSRSTSEPMRCCPDVFWMPVHKNFVFHSSALAHIPTSRSQTQATMYPRTHPDHPKGCPSGLKQAHSRDTASSGNGWMGPIVEPMECSTHPICHVLCRDRARWHLRRRSTKDWHLQRHTTIKTALSRLDKTLYRVDKVNMSNLDNIV